VSRPAGAEATGGPGPPSHVGEALAATLGVDERPARLADVLVPAVADFCTTPTLDGGVVVPGDRVAA
jgi:hypothetical protein